MTYFLVLKKCNIGFFLDTIKTISFKLFMIMTLIGSYIVILGLMTLTLFQGHWCVRNINCKLHAATQYTDLRNCSTSAIPQYICSFSVGPLHLGTSAAPHICKNEVHPQYLGTSAAVQYIRSTSVHLHHRKRSSTGGGKLAICTKDSYEFRL